MKTPELSEIKYPRRRFIRGFLRAALELAVPALTHFEIHGRENIPSSGPLIVVFNHFSFADPAILIHVMPRPIEFIGGRVNPGAPPVTRIFPRLYGIFPVFRGTASTYALKAATHVLNQGGVLGVSPEGGSWATVLRPARPGAAYLAVRSQAPILPVGFHGADTIFPSLTQEHHRTKLIVRIGKSFGPFQVMGRGRERREKLDQIGNEIMMRIRDLIPPERHGIFSDDPVLRAEAEKVADFPWAEKTETEFRAGEQLQD